MQRLNEGVSPSLSHNVRRGQAGTGQSGVADAEVREAREIEVACAGEPRALRSDVDPSSDHIACFARGCN